MNDKASTIIRFDKDTGFSLNGIRTKLKGVCVHAVFGAGRHGDAFCDGHAVWMHGHGDVERQSLWHCKRVKRHGNGTCGG